eukprot:2722761-Pyramimonas_sp.AAC.1
MSHFSAVPLDAAGCPAMADCPAWLLGGARLLPSSRGYAAGNRGPAMPGLEGVVHHRLDRA